jgi:3-mercaptopyruvate sulfurtransferase SseA
MKLISCDELKEKLDSGDDLKLVFVLGSWYYETAHIPGSINLPLDLPMDKATMDHLFSSPDAFHGLDPQDNIVVYCSNDACYASTLCYELLERRGFQNVRRYAGGLLEWYDAGHPLVGNLVEQ